MNCPLTGEVNFDIASIQREEKKVPKSGRCIVISTRFFTCNSAVSASQNTSFTTRPFDLAVSRKTRGHSYRRVCDGISQTNTVPFSLTAISRLGKEGETVNVTIGKEEGARNKSSIATILEKTLMTRHSIQLSKKTSPSLVPTARILSRGRDDWGYNQQPYVQFYYEILHK